MSDDRIAAPPAAEPHPDDRPPEPASGLRVSQGVLWALALLVVLLVIASWVALASEPPDTGTGTDVVRLGNAPTGAARSGLDTSNAMIGRPAPAVTWTDFAGGDTTLTSLQGRPVLVNFWRSDCPPCVTEMPDLERIHQELGDRVAFVGLAFQDRDDAARELAARTGVTYPLGFDRDGRVAQAFGAIGLPTTVLIDREGTIVYVHLGAVQADDLRRTIDEKLRP